MLLKNVFILWSLLFVLPLGAKAVQFLDQRDEAFYESGFLQKGEDSKLCGAVSALNWLLLYNPDLFGSREAQVKFIQSNNEQLLKTHNVDAREGLTDFELKKYLEVQSQRLQQTQTFEVLDLRKDSIDKVQSLLSASQQQILLVRFKQRPMSKSPAMGSLGGRGGRNSGFPPSTSVGLPIEEALMQVQHFVLQVKWDAESGVLWVVDSENPYTYTQLKIQESHSAGGPQVRLVGVTGNEFPRFRWGVPTDWHLLSLLRIKK